MSTYDLISILELEKYSPSEIVELLSNINKYSVEEYAIENMVCPVCYGDLITKNWYESRGEYFGFSSQEEMNQLICQSCGWVEE